MDFALQTSGTYRQVLDMALWAERHGLVSLALPDHYVMSVRRDQLDVPAPDCFAQLAGLARETASIELSVLVSPITFRHPAVLAKLGATIAEMSGGRFSLGVGTGWLDMEHELFGFEYPPLATRFDMLEDALGYLRAAFAVEPIAHEGPFYRLAAFDMVPSQRVPIVVGGRGRLRTPRLAGTFADEYNAYPAPPDEFAARIGRAYRAAVAAGRDPAGILLSSSGNVVVANTETGYREKLSRQAKSAGMAVAEIEQHLADRNAPRGTAGQVQEVLGHLEEAGVTRFYLQTSGDTPLEAVEETLQLMGA
ncbi:MAG: LLM class flavin-dependent oxidoreductase [Acidimicrobiia bacterium]|nr:LLM class flavin-dependent oxidoreductase [Acidimicrobiia bacterium]